MTRLFGALALAAAVTFSASSVSGAAPFLKSTKKIESRSDVIQVGKLRHRHRHCHITVTLGHAKKRCHTHRHNKVAHHGPRYH